MKNFTHMISIINEKIFNHSSDLKLIHYKDLTTETLGIVFNNYNTTMTIVRSSNRWCFTIKMKIQDDSNFVNKLKTYGFSFQPHIEDNLRKKLAPINREKDAITQEFGFPVEYEVEQFFYFDKLDELSEMLMTCNHNVNGTFIFIKANDNDDATISYEYIGYVGKDLIEKKYDVLSENELCIIYLHLNFCKQGNVAICSEINAYNVKDYLKLLHMVQI